VDDPKELLVSAFALLASQPTGKSLATPQLYLDNKLLAEGAPVHNQKERVALCARIYET
jgi:hypothetical protein